MCNHTDTIRVTMLRDSSGKSIREIVDPSGGIVVCKTCEFTYDFADRPIDITDAEFWIGV